MSDIAARELRNDVSGVLRRAERGEHLRITVSGRPVAELIPLTHRPQSVAWSEFIAQRERWRADPGLARDLAELLPDTTTISPRGDAPSPTQWVAG
jgi:prevent-host-death family protein